MTVDFYLVNDTYLAYLKGFDNRVSMNHGSSPRPFVAVLASCLGKDKIRNILEEEIEKIELQIEKEENEEQKLYLKGEIGVIRDFESYLNGYNRYGEDY